jgi:hypothetical protein
MAVLPATASVPHLKSITISPDSVSLAPTQTQKLKATGMYSDNTTQDLTAQVTWTSKKTDVATVDAKGVVTAVSGGSTEVNASDTASGVSSAHPSVVTVLALTSLALNPASASVPEGHTLQLQAIGTFEGGVTANLTPLVTWSSSSSNVLAVSNKGLLTPGKEGIAKITAKDPFSGISVTGTYNSVAQLSAIIVSPQSALVPLAHSTTFKAIGTFHNGTVDISPFVTFASSDTSVATVGALGKARGVAIGVAKISATDPVTGITSTTTGGDATLNVVGALSSLRVSPATISTHVGSRKHLNCFATFQGSSGSFPFTKVTWASSDGATASVDKKGAVTCLAVGTTSISCSDHTAGITSTTSGGDSSVTCK